MQQQQVSTLQIRALGALCRLLSQVWRGRIALAIPRLHKVWTKYAANLFCAELEVSFKKKSITDFFWMFFRHLFGFWNACFISSSEVRLNTYVLVQMVILNRTPSAIDSTTKHETRHQKETRSNNPNQITRTKRECEHWHRNYQSWGNWQDQQQASVLHMACHFHSFHKENTKSVISHYLRLINNLIWWIFATKKWGRRR